MIAYPWLTLFAIMVTANHYWLDAAGGAVALGVGLVAGTAIDRHFHPDLHDRGSNDEPATSPGEPPDG